MGSLVKNTRGGVEGIVSKAGGGRISASWAGKRAGGVLRIACRETWAGRLYS